jgi:hypothetical protein
MEFNYNISHLYIKKNMVHVHINFRKNIIKNFVYENVILLLRNITP